VEMLKRIVCGKHMLLAFDKHYKLDGMEDTKRTKLHTPDEWVWRVSQKHPEFFLPSCSIHPYRLDALEALEVAHKRGVKLCKWLPNSMGIDPMNPICDAFYDRIKAYGMVILSHAGEERAVDCERFFPNLFFFCQLFSRSRSGSSRAGQPAADDAGAESGLQGDCGALRVAGNLRGL
jgi:predicted TIM-barrel fold metal-dependent hydrolase